MTFKLDLIIEPEELEAVIGQPGLTIIDLCQEQTYAQAHIQGSIHINPAELVCGIPPASGKLPSLEQLSSLFSRIGYDPDHHIVVYDDEGGGWAGRFIWTLDVIGHKNYSYLNGGILAWYKEAHPVDAEPVSVTPTAPVLTIHTDVIAEMETVLDSLADEHTKVWDARSAEEYAGTKLAAKRGGHIPGAINLDWLDTMDKTQNLRLLPLEVLKSKLSALGINPDDAIITHCQTHHRSGLTYLIAKALGHKVKAYHGSWAEWGNHTDTPIER
ncbi:rhodanese-like domain-containing protein [Gammaproteobacteria bacterium]|nr:rhodanese-like domain-containing protein [Gammaproteobacteria bacterium]